MIPLLLFLTGISIGSFLNVLIDRLPKGEDVVFGRSRCDFCGKTLRWFELIPLLSYLVQGGRCVRCHKHLSIQYPLVEFLTGVLFVATYLYAGNLISHDAFFWYRLAAALAIVSAAVVIVVTDFKYQIIPDSMLVVLLVVGFGIHIPLSVHDAMMHLVVGAATGLAFYSLWAGTRGRGMGFGDVKLSAVLGVILGYPKTIIALYAAFLTGALYGVILMIRKKGGMKSRVPFGPFLLFGAIVSLLWSDQILHWWGFL